MVPRGHAGLFMVVASVDCHERSRTSNQPGQASSCEMDLSGIAIAAVAAGYFFGQR